MYLFCQQYSYCIDIFIIKDCHCFLGHVVYEELWHMRWTCECLCVSPDSKVHGANMGPTWVLSAPDGPHVGPMNLAIRVWFDSEIHKTLLWWLCSWGWCCHTDKIWITCNAVITSISLTHWGQDKMAAICRGCFQMHFLEWKYANFD